MRKRKRLYIGLIGLVALLLFESLVFSEGLILSSEFWTIVAAEVLVGGIGLVLWMFRPEIMRHLGTDESPVEKRLPDTRTFGELMDDVKAQHDLTTTRNELPNEDFTEPSRPRPIHLRGEEDA